MRLGLLVAGLALTSGIASAYYHFVYYGGRVGAMTPVPVRFDLGSITSRTVYFFISDQGPTKFAAGDSFVSLVSQIRAAAEVWNGVQTSDLRVQFGGITTAGTQQAGPGIDVTFDDDIDPSLIAVGGVKTIADLSYFPSGYIPIVRSAIRLRKDLSTNDPVYSDKFFLTLVHEFGHTLGLQHTQTSSVMSTQITRSTTKARPLGADDIAGISVLYGNSQYATTTGSISGRVSYANNGQAANLASVVAITPRGEAVSTLTNPDGTYTISGLNPGSYLLYVHPLPALLPGEVTPANINLPVDVAGAVFAAGQAFDTVFFPGTRDAKLAKAIDVTVGASAEGNNFSVARRTASAVSSVELFGYVGDVAVKGPRMLPNAPSNLVMTAPGLVVNGRIASGVTVSLLGETGLYGTPTVFSNQFILFYASHTAAAGPRHLIVSLNNDIYVLPSAMTVVQNEAPSVVTLKPAVDDAGNKAVVVTGKSLSATTRVWFDGAPATINKVNPEGSLLVSPPPANGSYTAYVVALNGDGQTSAVGLGSAAPPPFGYDASAPPSFNVSPSSIAAGVDAMVEVTGINTNFVEGQTIAGFGSSEIVVKRRWVLSPTRLLLNVSVNATAAYGLTTLTIASGLALVSRPLSFQITPPSANQATMRGPVVNLATGLAGVPSGGTALMSGSGLPVSGPGVSLTVGGVAASFTSTGSTVTFQVPPGLNPGPAMVRMTATQGDPIAPILMQIDGVAPIITGATTDASGVVDATRPAKIGEVVTLVIYSITDGVNPFNPAALKVSVGGVDMPGVTVTQLNPLGGSLVQFLLGTNAPTGVQPVRLSIDTRVSNDIALAVR